MQTSDKFGGVIKLRVSEGIAGLVATSGNPILLDNAYEVLHCATMTPTRWLPGPPLLPHRGAAHDRAPASVS